MVSDLDNVGNVRVNLKMVFVKVSDKSDGNRMISISYLLEDEA